MRLSAWVTQYVVAACVFVVVDGIWLGVVAAQLYDDRLGDLLAEEPRVGAAVAFYALYVAGLVHFVVQPAVAAGSARRAWLVGGFFGLVTYATWGLTNWAVLADWPASLVPVDLAWGTVLAATVSGVTYAVARALSAWARA
jgi:uncharacterized membrane protein